jgi:hypothetical protein
MNRKRSTSALCFLCCLLFEKDRDATRETCQFVFEQEVTEGTEAIGR